MSRPSCDEQLFLWQRNVTVLRCSANQLGPSESLRFASVTNGFSTEEIQGCIPRSRRPPPARIELRKHWRLICCDRTEGSAITLLIAGARPYSSRCDRGVVGWESSNRAGVQCSRIARAPPKPRARRSTPLRRGPLLHGIVNQRHGERPGCGMCVADGGGGRGGAAFGDLSRSHQGRRCFALTQLCRWIGRAQGRSHRGGHACRTYHSGAQLLIRPEINWRHSFSCTVHGRCSHVWQGHNPSHVSQKRASRVFG